MTITAHLSALYDLLRVATLTPDEARRAADALRDLHRLALARGDDARQRRRTAEGTERLWRER